MQHLIRGTTTTRRERLRRMVLKQRTSRADLLRRGQMRCKYPPLCNGTIDLKLFAVRRTRSPATLAVLRVFQRGGVTSCCLPLGGAVACIV
jgi:hypothetical protein